MKISAVFKSNSTNSSSASYLAVQGRFKRNIEGKYLVAVEKMRQGKRKFEIKKKRCNLSKREMEVTEELKIVRLL